MICASCEAPNDASAASCIACGQPLVEQRGSPRPGALFAGRYQILEVLGRGGMGMVYKAQDKRLDETVALKVIRPDLAREARLHERFRSEIKLARRIRHRNVCGIFGDGEHEGVFYVCMELVDGVELRQLVRERGGLPAGEAFDAAIQIGEGLAAIHEVGIIHRDLKTANVMRDSRGVVRLMDFGLAKQWLAEDSGGMTASGHVVGTPDYMSPEQARGEKLTFASDLYALGVIVFELFTGEPPFRGDTPLTTLLKHLHDQPPLDGVAGRRLPRALLPVLRSALAKAPQQRFDSAAAMAAALREARDVASQDSAATPLRVPRAGDLPATLEGAAATKRVDVTEDMPAAAPAPLRTPSGGRSSSWSAPLAARRWGAVWLLAPLGFVAVAASFVLLKQAAPRLEPGPTADSIPPATSLAAAAPATLAAAAASSLGIRHEPVGCLIAGEFPLIEATLRNPADVGKARVFFRSSLAPDYYYVEMEQVGNRLVGKLPKPKLLASPISYYIALSPFESSETPPHAAVVATSASACPAGERVASVGPKGAVTVYSAVGGDLVLSLKDVFGIEDLVAALKDSDAGVRERAAAALGQLGPVASQAIGAAVKELKSTAAADRLGAASDLGTTGRRLLRQVTAGLVESLRDPDPRVRVASAEALGEIGPGFASAIAALREALKDPDAGVRKTAADALGSMGSVLASATAALEQASQNEKNKRVESAADAALDRIRSKRP